MDISNLAVYQYFLYGGGGPVCQSSIRIGEVIFTDEDTFVGELPSKSYYKMNGARQTEAVDHLQVRIHVTSAIHRGVFTGD